MRSNIAVVLVDTGNAASTSRLSIAVYAAAAVAVVATVVAPGWDQALLSSGVYLYSSFVPKTLDLDTQLKAGGLFASGNDPHANGTIVSSPSDLGWCPKPID